MMFRESRNEFTGRLRSFPCANWHGGSDRQPKHALPRWTSCSQSLDPTMRAPAASGSAIDARRQESQAEDLVGLYLKLQGMF